VKRLLVTDVDNTLFDWQLIWYESFSAMSRAALEISGLDPAKFYAECSILHQAHGTSEYSFVLSQLPSFRSMYGDDVLAVMQPAIDAFREARRNNLSLYPGVADALDVLKRNGVVIAAFTESKAFYTSYRFRKLGLDGPIDFLYSPPDHQLPAEPGEIRMYEPETYALKHTQHRLTPEGEVKPNPHILLSIIDELGFTPEETVYVGDNKLKDVFMAQQARVCDVYAAYGSAQHRADQYDLLKKVTHWTPEMVKRESEAIKPGAIVPTFSLETSFSEIIKIVGV